MLNESERIKTTVLKQLQYGACCRIHLHRECCLELGLSIISDYDEKGQLRRVCKDIPDSRLDRPFNELIKDGFIRKLRTRRTVYAFYELTQKGKDLFK